MLKLHDDQWLPQYFFPTGFLALSFLIRVKFASIVLVIFECFCVLEIV